MVSRAALGVLLGLVACRSPEPSSSPDEIEARANEVRGRLLAECQAGDESACRRLGMSSPAEDGAQTETNAATVEPVQETSQTLDLDTWPAGATGLFLGVSPVEIAAACTEMGGMVVGLRADQEVVLDPRRIDDGGTLMCSERQKIDPLKRGTSLDRFLLLTSDHAMVGFCLYDSKLQACSVQLGFEDKSEHFASELRRKLEKRFGALPISDADFQCRDPGDRDIAFRGIWSWSTTTLDDSGKPFPVGTLLLNYGCTPLVERPEPFFVLRDTLGMLREMGMLRGGQIIR